MKENCDRCNGSFEVNGFAFEKIDMVNGYTTEAVCRICSPKKPKNEEPITIKWVRTSAPVADVYFDGKPEINLADDPVTGQPRVFSCRAEKAAYLKERGLIEAGDRFHGAPVEFSKNQGSKVDSRHEVKMALKRVKEMGRDNRRQAYLKILKESAQRSSR